MKKLGWFLGVLLLVNSVSAEEVTYFLALGGDDANAGTEVAPFATFDRAKRAVREAVADGKPATVILAGGTYVLAEPLRFEKADSGRENAPVTWKAATGETVLLVGGTFLPKWEKVTDPAIRERLPEASRDKVVQIDLKAAGITDLGNPGSGGMELFYNGQPMNVSRYPNEGFMKITAITDKEPKDIRGTKGSSYPEFQCDDERVTRWGDEKEVWVHGYWFWDWADQRQKVESISAEKWLVLAGKHSYGYRVNQWFYAFNLLSEIDVPGEYMIDRENGILYFYPPKERSEGVLVFATLPVLLSCENIEYFTLEGLTLEYGRGNGVTYRNCKNLTVNRCVARNLAGCGMTGSGVNLTLSDCELYQLGKAGISVGGGDRKTLTPAGNLVTNNEIHDYGILQRCYAPGVTIHGVGNTASHNKIYNAPHMGMGFSGNDNIIEYNEIYNVCFESNDAGAIYTGRNWTMRGNILRYNYLHDIRGFRDRGCVGIYLDDQFSSAEMYGNIFKNVTRATMIGGGRDSKIVNNIFIDCAPCVHLDARGLGWQKDMTARWVEELREKGTNCGINIMTPPYSEKYPELTTILEKHPGTPCGNVVARNICVRGQWNGTKSGQWTGGSIWKQAAEWNTIENNLVDEDPLFVDEANGNYTLRPESPALKLGFEPIPWEKIGRKKTVSP
ncbi:MAG: right-handed parallel beta-helix repeat-containing protein [Planctomycetia bacterium]|nr:right-handed parallel beta-helix repeat-containing protein [Planctomycetia bacterium]